MNQNQDSPIPLRSSRQAHSYTVPNTTVPDIAEDDSYYTQRRNITSARRYQQPRITMPRQTEQHVDAYGREEIIQQGNRRLHVHYEKPPKRRHWVVPVGLTIMVMLFLWMLGSWAVTSWQAHQLDATYGNPRTWQVDAVVGHRDSSMHPSHFIFLNLNAHVVIIEIPGGDGAHTIVYTGAEIFGDNAASVPVTGEFRDVTGNGRVDMIVHVGNQSFVYLNDGTKFKSQQ